MGIRVSFNTSTRLVEVTEAPVIPDGQSVGLQTIDVQTDVYSDAKEDWNSLVAGIARGTFFPFVNSVSANTSLPGGRVEPTFTRIRNDLGWRFLPFDSDHELTLIGNILPFDETLPFIQARPGRTILITPDATQVAGLNNSSVSSAVFEKVMEDGETFAESQRIQRANAAGTIVQQLDGSYVILSKDGSVTRITGDDSANNGRVISDTDGS